MSGSASAVLDTAPTQAQGIGGFSDPTATTAESGEAELGDNLDGKEQALDD